MKLVKIILVFSYMCIQVYSQQYNSFFNKNAQQSSSQNYFNNAKSSSFQSSSQNYFSNQKSAPSQYSQSQRSYSGGSSCSEKNARYPTKTCDGYIECKDGISEEKLCPDGLLFNPQASGYPCQYPIEVDCTGREQIQPAISTDECPHQYGYYLMGDSQNCGQFKHCAQGKAYIFDCPENLAFNEETNTCDWPDQVKACDAERFLGFTCPPESKKLGAEELRFYRSPNDCQRYFVCIEGRPRAQNCGEGKVFNDLINSCDDEENVTDCRVSSSGLKKNYNNNNAYNSNSRSNYGSSSNIGFSQFNNNFNNNNRNNNNNNNRVGSSFSQSQTQTQYSRSQNPFVTSYGKQNTAINTQSQYNRSNKPFITQYRGRSDSSFKSSSSNTDRFGNYHG